MYGQPAAGGGGQGDDIYAGCATASSRDFRQRRRSLSCRRVQVQRLQLDDPAAAGGCRDGHGGARCARARRPPPAACRTKKRVAFRFVVTSGVGHQAPALVSSGRSSAAAAREADWVR